MRYAATKALTAPIRAQWKDYPWGASKRCTIDIRAPLLPCKQHFFLRSWSRNQHVVGECVSAVLKPNAKPTKEAFGEISKFAAPFNAFPLILFPAFVLLKLRQRTAGPELIIDFLKADIGYGRVSHSRLR